MTDVDRLLAGGVPERVVDKIVIVDVGCWRYDGSHNSHGYARAWINGKQRMVHRLTATAINGEPEDGQQADHLCRNRWCVRPSHIEWVSSSENTRRGESRAAATMRAVEDTGCCPNGHDMSLPNAWTTYNGHRKCRACGLESLKRSRDRNREAVRERDRIRKQEVRRVG